MFNLINILGQNTLPEQVEINKQNIAILADEVEKLGYQPKGEYSAETEYNHNDVVFYDNKLYVVTSDAAIVGVLPTNTTYWQQVTGDIRGQQGATGAQGPHGPAGPQGPQGETGEQGEQGETGEMALVCIVPYNSTNTAPTQGLIINGSALNFNRRPKLNDRFILIWNVTSTNLQYLCIMSVDTEGVIPMQCTVQYEYLLDGRQGEQGEQGETGEMALVYGQVIHRNQTLVENQDIVLTGLNMIVADFNRAPKADDQFVLLYFDTYAQKLYIGYDEVEGINSSTGAVTTVLYRDMHIVTGADGQNGTNGTDGKDALTPNINFENANAPYVGSGINLLWSQFNHKPAVNDSFIIVYVQTGTGKSYLCTCKVTSLNDSTQRAFSTVQSFVETTGAQGASGITLTLYSKTYQPTLAEIMNIILNAKGHVYGTIAFAVSGGIYGISPNDIEINGTTARFRYQKTVTTSGSQYFNLGYIGLKDITTNPAISWVDYISYDGTTFTSKTTTTSVQYDPSYSKIYYYNDSQLHS